MQTLIDIVTVHYCGQTYEFRHNPLVDGDIQNYINVRKMTIDEWNKYVNDLKLKIKVAQYAQFDYQI